MTFEEFVEYYNTYRRCPNDISPRTNVLNEKQLKNQYTKYMKSMESKAIVIDEQWEQVKEQVDTSKCQFISLLELHGFNQEINELKTKGSHLVYIVDIAHVFSRSGYPYMKYDLDNVIPLNRYSHSCLDTMKDPVSGNPITKEQHELYWKYIVGQEKYLELEERVYNHVNRNSSKEVTEEI